MTPQPPSAVTGPSTSATRQATASHRSLVRAGRSRGRPTPPGSLPGSTSTGIQSLGSTGSTGSARRCSPCRPTAGWTGDVDPVWSPDGTSLLLPGGVEIPVDGSTPRQLPADDPRSQWKATYSPDGADVAYISADGLAVAAADGSQARVLVPGVCRGLPSRAIGLAWSPTGDRIAFASKGERRADGYERPGDRTLRRRRGEWKRGVAGRHRRPDDVLGSIKFSPKGDQILFSRTDADGWALHCGAFTPTAPTSTDWWRGPAGAIGKR